MHLNSPAFSDSAWTAADARAFFARENPEPIAYSDAKELPHEKNRMPVGRRHHPKSDRPDHLRPAALLSQYFGCRPLAPVKAEADTTALLKQLLQQQRDLDLKLADIQKRLDSISTFLGDQRASSFDTVDRRLRDIQDDIKRQR